MNLASKTYDYAQNFAEDLRVLEFYRQRCVVNFVRDSEVPSNFSSRGLRDPATTYRLQADGWRKVSDMGTFNKNEFECS